MTDPDPLAELLGSSPVLTEVKNRARQMLAGAKAGRRLPPVLIQGESGTGKGLLARALHNASPRTDGPFIAVNCGAIPETLAESEFFGFARGAHSEARQSKVGLFQAADRGTIFLDEVGLLSEGHQARLLKVVEDRQVVPLGSTRPIPVDLWLISATNADLSADVHDHKFRRDLYERLAVLTFTLPPLRERPNDIVPLAERFLVRSCAEYGLRPKTLAPDAQRRLLEHPWRGNVRELSNVIERVALLVEADTIAAAHLELASPVRFELAPPISRASTNRRDSRERILETLEQQEGNITKTAAALGVTRKTLRDWMRQKGLYPYRDSRNLTTSARASQREAHGKPDVPAIPEEIDGLRSDVPLDGVAATRPSPASSLPQTAFDSSAEIRWERQWITLLRVVLAAEGDDMADTSRQLEIAADKVQIFGGRVIELGGASLEAAFGLDPLEDSAERAAYAALAIQRASAREREQSSATPGWKIALHAADSYLVGRVGTSPQIDPEAKSAASALLATLAAGATPGDVMVSHKVLPFLRRRFDLDGPLAAGVTGRAYRLLGRMDQWDSAPFVGRDGEMERLLSYGAAALRGEGQVVGVVGEPGVGKSRLIREFVRREEHSRWRVLEATCDGGGLALYHMAAELLRSYFNVRLGEPDVRKVIAEVLATSGENLESVRAPLETLLGVPGDDSQWNNLDPDERRQRTHGTVSGLLVRESERNPLLIVIEDAHWIDAESQSLLEDLVSAVTKAPVLVIVSYRPEYHPRWAERPAEIRVEPLPDETATKLLDELTGYHDSLEILKQQLVAWTGKNPFFLEESVRSLVEVGILTGTRGAYVQTRDIARIEIPKTVQEILDFRIRRLSASTQRVIWTAAVIGNQVPFRLLAAVASASAEARVSAKELNEGCVHLRESELLYERAGGAGVDLFFKHALTREVALDRVPKPALKELHGIILKEVERIYEKRHELIAKGTEAMEVVDHDGETLDEQVDLLAHHAFGGDVWDKAVMYLNRAGHRALTSAATLKASECFEKVLVALERVSGAPRPIDAIDAHLNLRDGLWPLARMPEVFKHLREAETLAGRVGDVRRQGWTACFLSQYFWAVGDHELALQAGDRARMMARELGDLALEGESGFYRGIALMALGRFSDAERVLALSVKEIDAALAASEQRFPSRRFGRNGPVIARGFLSVALADMGRFAEGQNYGKEAIAFAEDGHSPFAIVAAKTSLGSLYARKGEPEKAIPLLKEGLEVSRTHRLNNWFSNVAASLGRAYLDAGRVDEGVTLLEESIRLVERTGVVVDRSRWLTYLGDGYLAAGRMALARDAAERALAVARSHNERGNEALALLLLAELVTRTTSTTSDALSIFEQALAIAGELGMRPHEVRCHWALGFYLAIQDPTAAAHHADQAKELATEMHMKLPEPGRDLGDRQHKRSAPQ